MFGKKKKISKENKILEKIKEILSENMTIDTDALTEDSSFSADLEMDDIDQFELIMALEEEYGVELDENKYNYNTLKTIGDVIQALSKEGAQVQ